MAKFKVKNSSNPVKSNNPKAARHGKITKKSHSKNQDMSKVKTNSIKHTDEVGSSKKNKGKVVLVDTSKGNADQRVSSKHKIGMVKETPSKPPSVSNEVSQAASVPMQEVSHRKRKKRKVSKAHDGMSNWESLCSRLKIDPNSKKKVLEPVEREPEVDSCVTEASRSKTEVWFDNVDKILIEGGMEEETATVPKTQNDTSKNLVKPDSYQGVTHCVAMDCEMVGIGPQGEESILARVSIVNHYGVCLYDKFVLPRERVTDYRTHVSGVTKENLSTGEEFITVQKEVSDILKGKILVGHALHNDLKVLFLTHPHKMIRDTSKYKPFRQLFKGGIPSLKKLSDKILGVAVQEGQHSSVQDAQAAMRLYTMHRQRWEKELKLVWKQKKKAKKKEKKTSNS